MQRITNIIFLLTMFCSCFQQEDVCKKILGEWVLMGNYEAPDAIIFRSDNIYLVFNDMDYNDLPYTKNSSIKTDVDSVTALIEKGHWTYDQESRLITLVERDFILEDSEFNSCYGKEKELSFRVKKATNRELTLCSTGGKNWCNKYAKNTRCTPKGDDIYYQEIQQEHSGVSSAIIELPLSGSETDISFKDFTCEAEAALTLENKKHEKIFTKRIQPSQSGQTITTSLRGVTLLTIKVDTEEGKPWRFRVEIK